MESTNRIDLDFVVISPDKTVSIEQSDSTLYDRLNEKYQDFAGHELVSCYEFESDWTSWEVHPNGDEIVLLLSGEVDFILEVESEETCITLREPGQYLVVPKGVWHTATVTDKAKVLFMTPGQGTRHRKK